LDVLNVGKLTLREFIFVLGQLMFDAGGSLEQLGHRISYDDARRRYCMEPTSGNALMAMASDVLQEWIGIPDPIQEKRRNGDDERGT